MQDNDVAHRLHAVRESIAAKAARLYEPLPAVEPQPSTDTEPMPTGTAHENTYAPLHWSEGVVNFAPTPQIGAGVITGMTTEDSIRAKTTDYLNNNR